MQLTQMLMVRKPSLRRLISGGGVNHPNSDEIVHYLPVLAKHPLGCLILEWPSLGMIAQYGQNNDNTFVRARAYWIFLTSCVGINLGDTPRGLRHPRGVPSVDPSTLGQKSYTHSPSLKYSYNTIIANRFIILNQKCQK